MPSIDMSRIRESIKRKISSSPEILSELHISSISELSSMSDKQLEQLISPKLLGILSLSRKDIES